MNEIDNDVYDLMLDPSLDSSNDSWLFDDGSNDENNYVYRPGKVPSPFRKGKDLRKKNNCPREGAGRTPLHEKFPQVVETATAFITQQSYAADSRRRSSVGRACGTTIPSLKRHLEKEIPGLSVSATTFSRLMVPPSKHRKSGKLYKGLIEAKVAIKKNDERAFHIDSHYCSCRVKYRLEFAAQFSKEVVALSCDCMNKVHIGGMAVSRYHQVKKIHMINDSPNYPDHDFPQGSGYLITPCGYMELQQKTDAPREVQDEFGRSHLYTPRTGRIHIVNRSQKFHKMTIQEHTNDLLPILENSVTEGKTGAVLVVDGGPDWNESSWTVVVYLSRLLRRVDLDFLCLTKYAPKNSALNPIEHGWAPLSKMLTSVRLRSTLDGETQPPSAQSGLDPSQRTEKEAMVFDNAMEEINAFWNGRTFDGHVISSSYQPCRRQSAPYNDYETVHRIISSGSKARITEDDELHEELLFAIQHLHKRPRELCIVKCDNDTCLHCSTHPVRAVQAVQAIRRNAGPLLTPTPSTSHPGHFMTYIEKCENPDLDNTCTMSSFMEKSLGICPFCQCYMFSSKEDRKRHFSIIHPTLTVPTDLQ